MTVFEKTKKTRLKKGSDRTLGVIVGWRLNVVYFVSKSDYVRCYVITSVTIRSHLITFIIQNVIRSISLSIQE